VFVGRDSGRASRLRGANELFLSLAGRAKETQAAQKSGLAPGKISSCDEPISGPFNGNSDLEQPLRDRFGGLRDSSI
jgi:hypothetical protein